MGLRRWSRRYFQSSLFAALGTIGRWNGAARRSRRVGAVDYPPLAAQLADLMARTTASDREIEYINAHALPAKAPRLLVAELVARGLEGFVQNSLQTPRITEELRVPAFQFDRTEPYAWPRARPSLLIASPTKGQSAA
jgi:hypothetical protein